MKKTNDSIKFEYRIEVNEILTALETFVKEHPAEENKETVEETIKLLNKIYMDW